MDTFVYTQLPAYKVLSCQAAKYTTIKVLPNDTPFLGIQEWISNNIPVHKERGNEGVYYGCVLYPYMKIEE
jgi:hypothetical protein